MHEPTAWQGGVRHPARFPELDFNVTADVCVVGLGGSGLTAIGELMRQRKSVVGLDAGSVGSGAAGRNGGFLLAGLPLFHHDAVRALGRERACALYHRTIAELDLIATETPAAVRRHGSLRIAADSDEVLDCRAQLAAMAADNLPVEWYRGPEGEGLLIPTDGAMNPLLRCDMLASRVTNAGGGGAGGGSARLFEHSAAIEITGSLVWTARGSVRCSAVIVAVDGALAKVLPELRSRVRTARLQMLATEPSREVDLARPVYRRYGYDYWQQLPSGAIVLGGLRDRAFESEWTDEATPTEAMQSALGRLLREQLGVRAPITHRWAGIVGYTDDRMPVVAEVRPGVWAIGGYCGTGNVLGAICGRGVAQRVATGASPLLDGLLPG